MEGFATTSDGLRIHYRASVTTNVELTPLVFVPGMLGIVDFFERELREFGPRPVVVFSHRGLGQSEIPKTGQASFASRCKDLPAVLDALEIRTAILAAFSRGVSLAVQHALKFPDQVRALVLMDCDANYLKPTPTWLEQFKDKRHPQFHLETLTKYFAEGETVNLNERLTELRCPSLIVRGAREGSLLPADSAERMSRKLNGAPIVTLPNSGHGVAEEDFSFFRHSMLEFMETV